MDLITLLILILVVAVVLWLFSTYVVPALPQPIGKFALAIVAIILILAILAWAGLLNLGNLRLG
jgi:hypothetical protein